MGAIAPRILSEEQVCAHISTLTELGLIEKSRPHHEGDEFYRLKPPSYELMGRIYAEGYAEPPEGVDSVPWFACIVVKLLLEEKGIAVSREDFAGMAAVFMGFLSEGAMVRDVPPIQARPASASRGRSAERVKSRAVRDP